MARAFSYYYIASFFECYILGKKNSGKREINVFLASLLSKKCYDQRFMTWL